MTLATCKRSDGVAAVNAPAAWLAFVVAVLAVLAGCGDSADVPRPSAEAEPRTSTLGEELYGPDVGPTRWSLRFYEGYLAETLRGDVAEASDAFTDVVARAGLVDPAIAARAALRLAQLEALRGKRREAVELLARASVLGQHDNEIVEQADRLQGRLARLRTEGGQLAEVRGPPIGAPIDGASEQAQALFSRAEAQFREYLRVRLAPRLEGLRAGVRTKERAMDAAHRGYREVVALGEPAATAAAEFRAASLYHDLALALMFDLPPELEPRAAAKMRASLRASAIAHLRKADAAYRRALAGDRDPEAVGGDARWRAAAALGLRSVQDLLAASDTLAAP